MEVAKVCAIKIGNMVKVDSQFSWDGNPYLKVCISLNVMKWIIQGTLIKDQCYGVNNSI